MSRAGLARVWGILGALLALYSTGTWIVLQGGRSFAEIPGLEAKAPVTSAYLAVPVIGTLLGILAAVGLFYLRTPHGKGDTFLPVVALADAGPYNPTAWSMRLYQAFFVSVFLLLPAAALLKLNATVLERGVLRHEGDPALAGIALKNAFYLTRGGTPTDTAEHDCAAEILRPEGYIWLGNMRCDFVKASQLKPFKENGPRLTEDAEAGKPKACARDLAVKQSHQQRCEGIRDISEECETSERRCRGIQWLPWLSPILMIVPTLFGWAMLGWLLIELGHRRFAMSKTAPGQSEALSP